jgi:hypothetical protein
MHGAAARVSVRALMCKPTAFYYFYHFYHLNERDDYFVD